jgi:uncharacterized protein YutE (UPF0331/DUF86 family)
MLDRDLIQRKIKLVHEYNDTDPAIIFASVGDALKQYTHYCEAVLKFAEGNTTA